MSRNLKVGDVVKSKKYGNQMTVEDVNMEFISCAWFDSEHHLQRKIFIDNTLVMVG